MPRTPLADSFALLIRLVGLTIVYRGTNIFMVPDPNVEDM